MTWTGVSLPLEKRMNNVCKLELELETTPVRGGCLHANLEYVFAVNQLPVLAAGDALSFRPRGELGDTGVWANAGDDLMLSRDGGRREGLGGDEDKIDIRREGVEEFFNAISGVVMTPGEEGRGWTGSIDEPVKPEGIGTKSGLDEILDGFGLP